MKIMEHNSINKVIWSIALLTVILLASITFSYRIAFKIYQFDLFYLIFIAFYIFDIFLNFNISIKKKLKVINERKEISKIYFKSWLIPDILSAVPYLLIFLVFFKDFESIPHSLYLFSYIMLLIKVLKFFKLSRELEDSMRINPGLLRLLVFLFLFIQFLHYMSLGWILIGAGDGNTSIDLYIRSIYWCLTTVATIGYGDYSPNKNSNFQIIYTMIVEIFGVGMYGYIIGNVSGIIANLDATRSKFMSDMEEIRDFLRTKNIPENLQEKIKDYYSYLWETRKSFSQTSIVNKLPRTLSIEVLLHINKDILAKVDFFKKSNEIFIREIVQLLEPMIFLPNDFIIRQGEYGDCMYFIASGNAQVLIEDKRIAVLSDGSPFGEMALVRGEKRMASIQALDYCDIYKLSKVDFDNLRSKYPDFDKHVKQVINQRFNQKN